jgi:hypothetical protein
MTVRGANGVSVVRTSCNTAPIPTPHFGSAVRHWHVIESEAGYLPEAEPGICDDGMLALDALAHQIKDWVQSHPRSRPPVLVLRCTLCGLGVPATGSLEPHTTSSVLPICSRFRPKLHQNKKARVAICGLTWAYMVGDTGIEPVASTVSR